MIANIIDRFLGRTGRASSFADVSITSLGTTAYAAGDVLNPTATCLALQCVGHGTGDIVTLRNVSVWETCASGSRVKPALRIYFFESDYIVPAQNTAFTVDANVTMLGFVDVATGEYVEYDDLTPGGTIYSAAFVELTDTDTIGARPVTMRLGSTSRNLYAVVTTTGTPTFTASAALDFRFTFDS